MTNAKSRLVRIIALALVVLMIVPMALVGCGKDPVEDNNVANDNTAALEAAIAAADKAAADAKAAADKAAADAQAAIEAANKQIEEAKKQAADAQAKADELDKALESMKNTTTTQAPATTTAPKAPEVDKVVLDAHIADILYGDDSEFTKAYAEYNANSGIYAAVDYATASKLYADAATAILRADTVDYANQLVAGFIAALANIPTYSERVKEAYDAIDFASDKEVYDVVYAYAFSLKAAADLAAATQTDAVKAEIKALSAYGEAELDLLALIATEFYRYTGKDVAKADKTEVETVLYEDIWTEAQSLKIALAISNLFGGIDPVTGELEVKNIVYKSTLADDIEDIKELYADFQLAVKEEGAEALYAEFCIAFVGADYILTQEGDYLAAKLAAADERAAALLVAYDEYEAFADELKEIVDAYYDDATKAFLYFDWDDEVAEISALLNAWIAKYEFDYDDANFKAMMGTIGSTTDTYYQGFVAAKAYTDALATWNAALEAIDTKGVDKALDQVTKNGIFDYAAYNTAIKALDAWYNGTKEAKGIKDFEVEFKDIKAIKDFTAKKFNTAAIDELLDEVDFVVADITSAVAALNEFEKDGGYLDQIADILKKIKAVDVATITAKDFAKLDYKDQLDALALTMKMTKDSKTGEIDSKSLNYELLPYDALKAIEDAKEALLGALLEQAKVIVEAYIGWAGVEYEGKVAYPAPAAGTKPTKDQLYNIDKVEISIYSQEFLKSLETVYNNINIFELSDEAVEFKNIKGDDVLKLTVETVVSYYRQMYDTFHLVIAASLNTFANNIKNITLVNEKINANNEWKNYKAYDSADKYHANIKANATKYGAKVVFVSKSGDVKSDNAVYVYSSSFKVGTEVSKYSYQAAVDAVNMKDFAVLKSGKTDEYDTSKFKQAEYLAAVNKKITEYQTKFFEDEADGYYANENIANWDSTVDTILDTALDFGLWTIEETVKIGKDSFKIVVDSANSLAGKGTVTTYGSVPEYEITVFDTKGKVVAAGKTATITAKVNDVDTTYVISLEIKDGKATIMAGTDALNKVDATADNDDAYIYGLEDAKAAITASYAKIPNGVVINYKEGYTLVKFDAAWFAKIEKAYDMREFFDDKAAEIARAANAVAAAKVKADDNGDKLIDNLYAEWQAANTKNGAPKYGSITIEQFHEVVEQLIQQVNKLATEHEETIIA